MQAPKPQPILASSENCAGTRLCSSIARSIGSGPQAQTALYPSPSALVTRPRSPWEPSAVNTRTSPQTSRNSRSKNTSSAEPKPSAAAGLAPSLASSRAR